ncbi:MAG: ribosomal-processing cysteine protease Prp [Merdibacter sp.]
MVHVAVTRDAQEILELDVCGHAGQAPHGEDLVCAGVSSIMSAC